MTALVRALALVALATAAAAQGMSGSQYLTCECSPSKRGYRVTVFENLKNEVRNIAEEERNLKAQRPALTRVEIDRRLTEMAVSDWESCVNNHSAEECVNADAAIRLGACYPNCASICYYNRGTWKTIANGKLNPTCDTIKAFATQEQELIERTGNNPDVRPSAVNPKPGPQGNIPVTTFAPKTGNNNNSNNNRQ